MWKMFQLTRSKNDGSMVSDPANEIVVQFNSLSSQVSESPEPIGEVDIFRQVVGPERHGRVRGYGFGPTPSSVFGSSKSRFDLLSMLETEKKKNDMMQMQLDDIMKENEEERRRNKEEKRRNEEQRRRNEEDRKRNEEERKKMEERFEELCALIQGKFGSSSRGGI